MSYFIVDSNGEFKGDLCSSQGIEELEMIAQPALEEFLETGVANANLADAIKAEVVESKRTEYIERLFEGEAPFILRDGVEDE